jgi:ATP-binding cassette subfamily B protein
MSVSTLPTAATPVQTAAACLAAVARHYGIELSAGQLLEQHGDLLAGAGLTRVELAARALGLEARSGRMDWPDLARLDQGYPVVARLGNGNFIVLCGFRETDTGGGAVVLDPLSKAPGYLFVKEDQLRRAWRGEVLFARRRYRVSDEEQPFGLRWFVPAILKQRQDFINVAIAALLMQVVALILPLFFQNVIDKVLVHRNLSTLHVLGIGVLIAITFEAAFQYLRGYILLHATNRIDIGLATRTFDHLLKLPLAFFESSSAGVLVKHMQQAERIREFLTGRLFLTLLECFSLVVFLPLLFWYSPIMAVLIVGFAIVIAAVIFAILPIYRTYLTELYKAEGERQALLVETIHGMRTVKSLALEATQRRNWNQRAATAVLCQFDVGRVSTMAQVLVTWLQHLSTVAIIWLGAHLVISGHLLVGELVAIQMFAGRVTNPLVQLVSLVNQFQEISISVRMLGEIMNRKREREGTAGLHPTLQGAIAAESVNFYYPGVSTPTLADVSVDIRPGQMIGVVGPSGSGKTTFVRLLQGLYLPNSGTISFDGHDIREIDTQHLRRSIGVVVQESFMFRGTVRDNIAMKKPEADFSEIVKAARLAGADEFIQRLPRSYDTVLEEDAANLSGGQKQRLAVARALLTEPRVLIFDEATSALDPESEALLLANLDRIRSGKTLIIVSHRLSSIASADSILVFDRGAIVDQGNHAALLKRSKIYQQLWAQQTRVFATG